MPPTHSDPKLIEIASLVMGHSLVRSLVRSHRSPVRLLRTARFARALRCAHSFARSLTHSLPSSWESVILMSHNQAVLNHSAMYSYSVSEHFDNGTIIFHCPTSSGASELASEQTIERSEQCGAGKRLSGTSERPTGGASGPLLTPQF